MRRQVVTTLGVVTLCMASYATTFMQVKTDDGKTVSFDVDHVTEVVFDTTSSDHEYVDLGLPSGTLWATCNIGATKPEEFGDYFAWGETEPKEVYDWDSYKYAEGSWNEDKNQWILDSITKYNLGRKVPGAIDSLNVLFPEDDAATATWGLDWKIPTQKEWVELKENCQFSCIEINGVSGAKYTAKNGKYIFLPMTGSLFQSRKIDLYHGYWSSTLAEDDNERADGFYIDESFPGMSRLYRIWGFPVRAVRTYK